MGGPTSKTFKINQILTVLQIISWKMTYVWATSLQSQTTSRKTKTQIVDCPWTQLQLRLGSFPDWPIHMEALIPQMTFTRKMCLFPSPHWKKALDTRVPILELQFRFKAYRQDLLHRFKLTKMLSSCLRRKQSILSLPSSILTTLWTAAIGNSWVSNSKTSWWAYSTRPTSMTRWVCETIPQRERSSL